MAREDLVVKIKAAAMVVELEHLRCQRLSLRPISTFQRHRVWGIPLVGFVAGCTAGSAAGRKTGSALLSTGFLAMRLQPMVARFMKMSQAVFK